MSGAHAYVCVCVRASACVRDWVNIHRSLSGARINSTMYPCACVPEYWRACPLARSRGNSKKSAKKQKMWFSSFEQVDEDLPGLDGFKHGLSAPFL